MWYLILALLFGHVDKSADASTTSGPAQMRASSSELIGGEAAVPRPPRRPKK